MLYNLSLRVHITENSDINEVITYFNAETNIEATLKCQSFLKEEGHEIIEYFDDIYSDFNCFFCVSALNIQDFQWHKHEYLIAKIDKNFNFDPDDVSSDDSVKGF